MDIIKYKKLRNGKYQIITTTCTFELYEEVILKYNLLLSKKIDDKDSILKYNKRWDIYYTALKYLKSRTHSKKEVCDYLKKKEYPSEFIEEAILKLESQGYINDLVYARSFFNNKIITTSHGPLIIKKELQDKGVALEIICEVLDDYTDDIQKDKINKRINRIITSSRGKSNKAIMLKIRNDLYKEGFSQNLINAQLQNVQLEDDSDVYKKQYDKLYKRYSKKYSGYELECKIKQALYQKGFSYGKD